MSMTRHKKSSSRALRTWSTAVVALATLPATACYFLHMGGGGMPDEGILSPTHKAHVGGMVFSKELVIPGKENPAALGDHCTLGDGGCYGAFYLAKAAHEYGGRHEMSAGSYALRASLDGGTPQDAPAYLIYDYASASNFILLRAKTDNTRLDNHPRWFLEAFGNQLTPGDHTLDLSVLMTSRTGQVTGQPIATGKLTITVPSNGSELVAAAMAHEQKIHQEAKADEQAYEAERAATCLPNGTSRDGLVSSTDCCSDKIHEIYNDPSNEYSGTKASVCCGSKDDAPTSECH